MKISSAGSNLPTKIPARNPGLAPSVKRDTSSADTLSRGDTRSETTTTAPQTPDQPVRNMRSSQAQIQNMQKMFETQAQDEIRSVPTLEKRGIDLRPFRPEDLPQVLEIVAAGFRQRFGKISSLPQNRMAEFVNDMGFVASEPSPGYIVADREGHILGLVDLRFPTERSVTPPLPPGERLARHGLIASLKGSMGKLLTETGLNPDECLLEHLAIRPEAQEKGVLAGLLIKARDIASEHPEIHRITFPVSDEGHPMSRILSEALGFQPDYTHTSLAGLAFLGLPQWHYLGLSLNGGKGPAIPLTGFWRTWFHRRRKLWWLGFLGFITLLKFPDMLSYFDGRGTSRVFLHLLWLVYFRCFLPRRP